MIVATSFYTPGIYLVAYLKGQLPVIQRRVDPVTGVGLISDNDLLVLVVLQVARRNVPFLFFWLPSRNVSERKTNLQTYKKRII